MKKRPLIVIQLFIISVLFITLATSCKKSDENDPAIIKDGDGNSYNSVTIGTQVWLVENLKTTKLNDGTPIPLVTDQTTWKALTTMGYCWYDNNETEYKSDYGALYNWYAAKNDKLCPKGWHIPTDAEWTTLITPLGGDAAAGGKLKEKGTLHWENPNEGATDEVGFSAVGGGYRADSDGSFYYKGRYGLYWSSTDYSATNAWFRCLYHDDDDVSRSKDWTKKNGFSVRCIKD